MDVPHQAQIRDPTYHDWVRAVLALKYTQEGIKSFIDHETKEFHKALLNKLGQQSQKCNLCTMDNLLPHETKACPVGRMNCICSKNPRKQRRICPRNTCGTLFDEMVSAHRFKRPSWKNSNMSEWIADHWEVAKNFLSNTGGYLNITSAADTDLSGLINIGINLKNIALRHNLTVSKSNGPDIFVKCREARNDILHSVSQSLTHVELMDHISVMKNTLQCTGALQNNAAAQLAVTKLTQLETSGFVISDENITEVRRMVELAIQDEASKQIGAITEKGEEQKEYVVNSVIQAEKRALEDIAFEGDIKKKLLKTEGEEARKVIQCEGNQQVEAVMGEGAKQIQNIQQATTTQADAIYQEERNKLKCHLIDNYIAQLQPITLPEVDRLYVQPSLELLTCVTLGSEDSRGSKKLRKKNMTVKEVFSQEQTKFTQIYISGDAGHGKTTLCKMLILAWCQEHSDKKINEHIPPDFLPVMKMFDFLFYITLRNVKKDWIISEMIKKQYFENQIFLDKFLKNESDKRSCLVILDGLDEWNIPNDYETPMHSSYGLPDLRHFKKYTVLTTTRPWNLEIVRPKQHEMDRHVRLTGIGKGALNKYIENMVDLLNRERNSRKKSHDFEHQLKNKQLTHLQNIPILLKQFIMLWHRDENELTGSSQVHLYSAMINHLLKDAWERNENKSLSGGNTKESELPLCLKEKQYCKIHKDLLYSLSSLAFTSAISGNLTFKHVDVELENLTENDIRFCLRSGLLCQEIYASQQDDEKKILSFLHKSFQDFLAAVFLVMNPGLAKRLGTWNTFQKILNMRYFFIFVSGMDSQAITPLSQQIQNILENDEHVKEYSSEFFEHLKPIQKLMCDCVKESKASKQQLPLCHLKCVVLGKDFLRDTDLETLQNLISTNLSDIKYVYIYRMIDPPEDVLACLRNVLECKSVQHARLELSERISLDTLLDKALHENWSLLSLELMISGCATYCRYLLHSDIMVSLVKLDISCVDMGNHAEYQGLLGGVGRTAHLNTLKLTDITLDDECKLKNCSHHLDLSKCSQLQQLNLQESQVCKVTINTTSLTYCRVHSACVYFHPQHPYVNTIIQTLDLQKIADLRSLNEIFTSLPHQAHLSYLTLMELDFADGEETNSYHLDLSKCSHIRSLNIENCKVTTVTISASLTYCKISGTPVFFGANPTNIQTLELKEIADPKSLDEIVTIFPKLNRLSRLTLVNLDFDDRDVHLSPETSYLEMVELENVMMKRQDIIRILTPTTASCDKVILTFIGGINSKTTLSLDYIAYILPYLTHLSKLKLEELDFGDRHVSLSPMATNLKIVELYEVKMTDRAMIHFLDSLLTINSKVCCNIIGELNEAVKTHVNTKFEVTRKRDMDRHGPVLLFHNQPAAPGKSIGRKSICR